MAEDEKKKSLKYTVLLVPNNAHRVKQFHVSFDFAIVISICVFALIFAGVSYVTYSASKIEQMQAELDACREKMNTVSDENIILQADIEELTNALREAKVTLDAKNTAEENEEKEATMQYIPSGFPMDGTVSLPTEYTEENRYVVFQAGYGTKVVASADGTVSYVGDDTKYGHVVKVDHGNGYVSVYMDVSDPVVSEGDRVIRGTTLFVMKNDTETLTYQILFNDELIDPMTVIEING